VPGPPHATLAASEATLEKHHFDSLPVVGPRGELLGAVNVIIELETILAGARRMSEGCGAAT
jgi:CBS domain-containing protein